MGVAATLAVALAVLTLGQESITVVAPPSPFPRYDPPPVDMPRRVFELTGPNPRDCGRYLGARREGRFEGATRDQLRAAISCAPRAGRLTLLLVRQLAVWWTGL